MITLPDPRRLGLFLLLLPISLLAADPKAQSALDADFLLFLNEWVDDSGEVFEPDNLEPSREVPPSETEEGQAARPQEEGDA
ncbi:hypothetical protein [Microbulbifer thermotolerans]|uniref:Uncharacterized protein n=1 Tax=Microbulbifer thermotolerans TaxID=252514 RepID=A0A143HKA8_MICTH|nr:hypothetical protein [Microbulbifer thermotolerans]AMX02165.1 hypothetical protein A3224_05830 [Microbulbifer thermotolerans]MCX2778869.1 hypothetical protein [Microbulbifer thermotolerans]MCX2784321.1 hypothetical protein [Microbulbifer thermotolerans]MCX2793755.1 hypothetical protein [Microbulbifer thermotolerans]MCX2800938.1 hypothetical protein [Microbulbifer thermotolerans]